ncbi:threonine aldolase family protein [Actinotalea lenta]|uniref:threonine aldolase family protein n=1 Tax=Actinotalea lenta TaxID=3064654 RepID=UPI003D9C7608
MAIMTLHDPARRTFASDNYAGAHAEVLAAVADASGGHETSYGADAYTTRLTQVLGEHFGRQVEVFPVFTGTGANVVGLSAMLPAWGAVVCAASAHVHTDEGGAPEKVAGIKLLPVPTPDGRLTPELLATEAWGYGFEHRAQPLVVSLTQTTELGTCYTPEQIAALADAAHARGMRVHVDGARLANAAATLDLPLRAFTSDVGVDVVSLGGTKNGALAAEAVVVLDPAAADGLAYLRKTQMQLASKMRFVSAQLLALFDGDLWLRSAQHANAMARRLLAGVRDLPGVQVTRPVESNAVFAILARDVADRIREDFWFYDWDEATGEVRWMCAFDTTPADVDAFVAAVAKAAG